MIQSGDEASSPAGLVLVFWVFLDVVDIVKVEDAQLPALASSLDHIQSLIYLSGRNGEAHFANCTSFSFTALAGAAAALAEGEAQS